VLFLFQLSSFTIETKAYMRVAGYSWKTNEYGLAVDSVTEFHLVLPNGTQSVVTEADNDLWFALKVCLNDGDGWGCNKLSADPYYRVDSTTM
jgi:hypothetical protein